MHAALPTSEESPRDSASLVLLRDEPEGLQVLLLRRNARASNMAGVYVFPGGKLDPEDHWQDGALHLDQSASRLVEALAESATPAALASALYVAALREALEECGLLLAEPRTIAVDAAAEGDAMARLEAARSGVDVASARARLRAGEGFTDLLDAMNLRLQTRALTPWSRWITPTTPSMTSRRFDTRFFVARAPLGQVARHDDEETVDTQWLAPRKALEQYRDGSIDLAPPQIMTLAHLARYASADHVLQAAASRRPPTILPQAFDDGTGVRIICYPGDERHAVRDCAMPGPTRLYLRERRFAPEHGFEALFE